EGQVIMRSHRPDKSTQQFADHDLPKESGFSEGIATYQAKPLEIKTVEQELTIMGKHDFTVVVIPNFFPVKEIVENHISPEAYRLSKIRSPEHIKGPRDNCVTEFMWHYSYIEKEFNKVFSSNSITSIDSVIKVSDVLRIVLELAEDVNAMGGTAHVLEYKQGQDLSLFIKKLKSDL
ncbi:MAG: hypothetical protein LUQ18_09770, partial [Methylococcaceae bacterium]|nr:hypothetical protein [Methylococcaceae bacterium]